jgi:tetratricopeptide (TPR) repeat protein
MVKQNKLLWQIAAFSLLKKLVWLLLIYATSVFAQKENKFIRSGNNEYEDQKYKEAEVDYMKALEKNPESFKVQYNLGGALYKQENYKDASDLYNSLASKSPDRREQANAYYNLGNSLLKAQKYPESIDAYKKSLRINPSDEDAKYNMEFAKKMLKQQEQQKQNQDENKDQEKKDDEQQKQDEQQKEEQQQDKQNQQEQQKQDQQQNPQQQQQQISKQDAERMLEALKNEENKTMEKVNLQKIQVGKAKSSEKDW